ncbi:MAG: hypothetical protein JXA30_04530 [Deltaproteobacteria bacterium]|nr:hypothetical protein [Deltaproteobacteria bacterium]
MKAYAFQVLLVLVIAAFSELGCGSDDDTGEGQSAGTGGAGAAGSITGGATGAVGGVGGASGEVGGTTSTTGGTGGTGGTGASAGTGGTGASAGTGGTGATGPAGTGGTQPATGGSPAGDAGVDAEPAQTDAGSTTGGGVLPEVASVEEDGPFEAIIDTSGEHHVWRPAVLGENGLKHPVFVWGTGFGSTPTNYDDFFIRFATHGFVVVAPTPASLSASNMSAALEWIVGQNDAQGSVFYQKLDLERIAMGGHSQGSMATFNVEATETRLKTTIHIAGGSSDGLGSSKVKTPTAYICGETDFLLPQCMTDFENVGDQPTFFSELAGVDHIYCAREALPGMIAWLRWHLADEKWRSAMFTGPDGEFFQGIWNSQTKNWNW